MGEFENLEANLTPVANMTIRTRRSSARPRKSHRRPTRPSVNSLAIAEAYGIGPTSARDKSKCPTARVPSRAHSVEIAEAYGLDRPRRKSVQAVASPDHQRGSESRADPVVSQIAERDASAVVSHHDHQKR